MGVTLDDLGGWPQVLSRLFAGEDLSSDEATAVLTDVLSGSARPTQIAAFAASMRTKGETAEEITGLVAAMRQYGESVDLGPGLLDTCGTGGDRSGTINVSTMSALVAAAAGARVCKHGNRAQSSISGSADLLEALGISIELGPVGVARCVREAGMGFCLAPRYHPAMRHAGPVRRELGAATVFNFLGPLANPARATRQLVGVGDASMAPKLLAVLEANGAEHAMVVFGHDGLDELSIVAPSTVLETVRRDDGSYDRTEYVVTAEDFSLGAASREDLLGGTAQLNAEIVGSVFSGEPGARRDFTLLNSGAALVVAGLAPDIASGIERAAEVIDSGAATAKLSDIVRVSNEAAAAESRIPATR